MLVKLRTRLTYANVVSTLCLFILLGGTSYAVATGSIDSREIKNDTIRSRDVRNGSLLAGDFRPGQLPRGAVGAQGPQGLTGPTGPRGLPGPPGAAAPEQSKRLDQVAGSSGAEVFEVPGLFRLETNVCNTGTQEGSLRFKNLFGAEVDVGSVGGTPSNAGYALTASGAGAESIMLATTGQTFISETYVIGFGAPGSKVLILHLSRRVAPNGVQVCRYSARAELDPE